MSLFDKSKHAFGKVRGHAGRLAEQHGDKVDQAIDRGSSYLNKRTKGKYSGKIHKAGDSAKDAATRLADQYGDGRSTGSPETAAEQAQVRPPQPDPADPINRSTSNPEDPKNR